MRQFAGEDIQQSLKSALAETLMIDLTVPNRDQSAQQAPRCRRPFHIRFVYVPSPRGSMVAPGGKPQGDGKHDYFS